ncbi:MAG: carboxypeptidase-like regulatory domain-containing protein [Lewinellaceae bacterium]|nr:carboxypeptidase-like regulatory domain-containing protein [Lewinellaceae bacterium]
MNTKPGRRLWVAVFFMALSVSAFSQALTIVHGRIVDASNDDPMPYVSLKFDGTSLGVVSDINGNFYIETKEKVTSLTVSLVGFKTQSFKVGAGKNTELTIRLEESGTDLREVVVKSGRYRNRNNPAVDLIQKAIDHKDRNRKEALDYYNYEKYEKVQFALNNVTDKMRNGFLFKKIQFIFDNVDTNRVSGDVSLPFFLRETLSDVYYRKSPSSQKEYIRGERNSTLPGYLDNQGLSSGIENLYQDVDFYKNAINLVTVDFVSPLAPISPNIYRFYILDTVKIDQTPAPICISRPGKRATWVLWVTSGSLLTPPTPCVK